MTISVECLEEGNASVLVLVDTDVSSSNDFPVLNIGNGCLFLLPKSKFVENLNDPGDPNRRLSLSFDESKDGVLKVFFG